MSSKNRKVYQMGNMSIREFFSAPTRYLAQSINKESEFEKPYLDEDRGKMHMDWPWPDWPPMPDIPPWPPLKPPDGPVPGLPGCAIVCYPPGGGDCDEPIWCHPGIWCGSDIGCTLCTWVVEGATSGYSPHLSGVGSWGIDIWIDQSLLTEGKALITACMTDPCANICCKDIEVTCKVCPPDIVMTWDSDLNLTIGQGNGGYATAVVDVKDGLGPYSWSVAGTGFSMLHSETDGVSNTLQADATACGLATITVTDYCGDTTVGYVRCTAGQWTEIPFTSCILTGAPDTPGGNVKTEGKYRLTEDWGSTCSVSLSSYYNGYYNCIERYNACSLDSCKCDTASGCHATMKCTKCLSTAKCSGSTLCVDSATCVCCGSTASGGCLCIDTDIERCYIACKCMKDTSKLEEWTCVP